MLWGRGVGEGSSAHVAPDPLVQTAGLDTKKRVTVPHPYWECMWDGKPFLQVPHRALRAQGSHRGSWPLSGLREALGGSQMWRDGLSHCSNRQILVGVVR